MWMAPVCSWKLQGADVLVRKGAPTSPEGLKEIDRRDKY